MKYALKKIRRIIANDLATKAHLATISDLTNVSITGSQETVWAQGTDGERLVGFDINKVAGLTATNGTVNTDILALQVGSEVKKVTNGNGILLREKIKVTAEGQTTVVFPHAVSGSTGNEIGFIYKADKYGDPMNEFKYAQAAAASSTEFAYDTSTKTITLPTDAFAKDDVIIVDYRPTFSEYKELKNKSTSFSQTCEIIVDAWFTDLCDNTDIPLQLYLSKGKFAGNIDLAWGNAAAVQNITIEAMSNICDEDKSLWVLRDYDLQNIVD